LLEYIVHQLPQGLHNWNKFIQPEKLTNTMQRVGFKDILIKGFYLTDSNSFTRLKNIIFTGLAAQIDDKRVLLFEIPINEYPSVWYISKAMKIAQFFLFKSITVIQVNS
jgi:2-polyprenyl-6-hydroxyphenyl methylase / 3-demethylubiquinone-9 3-methyltransferase